MTQFMLDDLVGGLVRLWPLFASVAGLWLTHWLTLGREQRKEWIACCDELGRRRNSTRARGTEAPDC